MANDSMGSILEFSQSLKDAQAPEALAAGDYPAEIVGAEYGVSQNSGKPRVDITFKVKPEDYPADYVDAESFADGKQMHFYLSAQDDKASRFRVRKFCEAIGAKLGAKIDINDWIGKTAVISIIPDEYEGVDRERISRVNAK
jgi:hypothetical protein